MAALARRQLVLVTVLLEEMLQETLEHLTVTAVVVEVDQTR